MQITKIDYFTHCKIVLFKIVTLVDYILINTEIIVSNSFLNISYVMLHFNFENTALRKTNQSKFI